MRLFGTSGIRTLFNRELLDLAFKVGLAAGRRYGNVVVSTDTRTSRDAMKHAVISGLLAAGARCRDAGVAPTPTLALITRDYDAGVMITASHNPPEYNGIKLLNPDGSSFTVSQQEQMEQAILDGSLDVAPWAEIKNSGLYDGAIEHHIECIYSSFPSELKLKVVVDAGCGAASEVTPRLFQKFGCEIIALNCNPSGFFPRGIEPTEANLADLRKAVKESGADLGIAHDGDADRMMAVDDRGEFIPGDKLLPIFARAVGAKEVVTTLDASMAIEEMGFNVRRTEIGDTAVSEELRNGGDFGGETSGSWIFPNISLCPDGIYAAAQVLAIASQHRLSELVDSIPYYPLLRGNASSNGVIMSRLESGLMAMEPLSVSRIDGIKLDFEDGWLLVRASGTEPKIRLTAEAKNEARAKQLYESGLRAIRDSVDTGGKAS
jgi:phosphoglucosamine mutase